MLIVAHRTAFDAAYGQGAWESTEPEVARYIAATSDRDPAAALLFLDDPPASGFPDVSPADTTGESAASATRAVLRRMTPRPDAVLLLGGDEALPMVRMAMVPTVEGDTDRDIPTDNPYGCTSDDWSRFVDPVVPVGRLAAGAGAGGGAVIAQLERAAAARAESAALSGSLVVSNTEWIGASHIVAGAMAEAPQIFASSPTYRFNFGSAEWQGQSLFFNLHGEPGRPYWFGRTGSATWTAVSADDLAQASLRSSVAFSCACYGGEIAGRRARDSMALALVHAGAAAVIVSTGFAFGSIADDRCDFSEELARRFFVARAAGFGAGRAFWQARHDYLRARVQHGSLANRDYKTALQFVYMGDPLL